MKVSLSLRPRLARVASKSWEAEPVSTGRVRRSSAGWADAVTQPAICAAALVIAILLVAAGLVFRVSAARRQAEGGLVTLPTQEVAAGPKLEVLAEIESQAKAAQARLIHGREEFVRLLTEVEDEAQKRGWRMDLSLSPGIPAPSGLDRLTLHRAVAQMTPLTSEAARQYSTILEWLDGISRHRSHLDLGGLSMEGDTNGLSRIRVELQSLGSKSNG